MGTGGHVGQTLSSALRCLGCAGSLLVGKFANNSPTRALRMVYVDKGKQKIPDCGEESQGPICHRRTAM